MERCSFRKDGAKKWTTRGCVGAANTKADRGKTLSRNGAWTTGIARTSIQLSNFAFEPEEIRLRTGALVRLLLVNESSGGHNFSAPGFFAASKSLTGSAPPVGIVDVPAKGRVEITVVPVTPGTYRVECTHFLHALFGMTGRIIVEAAQS
jgi:plastocyanin